jgi:hypothetical protein
MQKRADNDSVPPRALDKTEGLIFRSRFIVLLRLKQLRAAKRILVVGRLLWAIAYDQHPPYTSTSPTT